KRVDRAARWPPAGFGPISCACPARSRLSRSRSLSPLFPHRAARHAPDSMTRYRIPAASTRIENEVSRSRFIATLANAATVEAARGFIAEIRSEMPDASHHVYAFKVGYGS